MITKIKYALYGVKLDAQNFVLSHIDDIWLKTMPDINQFCQFRTFMFCKLMNECIVLLRHGVVLYTVYSSGLAVLYLSYCK